MKETIVVYYSPVRLRFYLSWIYHNRLSL